jgi:hypothetical protein
MGDLESPGRLTAHGLQHASNPPETTARTHGMDTAKCKALINIPQGFAGSEKAPDTKLADIDP